MAGLGGSESFDRGIGIGLSGVQSHLALPRAEKFI